MSFMAIPASSGPLTGRLPQLGGVTPQDRQRKIAVKCLELEEMLERQGHSQSEIECKVASFRSLLLRQVSCTTNNNNKEKRKEVTDLVLAGQHDKKRKHSPERRKRNKRRQRKDSRDRSSKKKKKKRKEKRRKKYCSSPSYSDYEPENPFLRMRNKANNVTEETAKKLNEQKVLIIDDEQEPKKKKSKKKSRSLSRSRSRSTNRSRSRSRSKPRKRKSRSKHKSKRKKRKSKDSPGRKEDDSHEDVSNNQTSATKGPGDGKIYPKHLPKRILKTMAGDSDKQENNKKSDQEKEGKIIFSKIEEIPTSPRRRQTPEKKFERNTFVSSEIVTKEMKGPKLSFEINGPGRKVSTAKQVSTFAELSKKLGSKRKLKKNGMKTTVTDEKSDGKLVMLDEHKKGKLPPLADHIQEMKNDDPLDVVDNELEESFREFNEHLEASKSRSRSNSLSPSQSRSVSRSRERSSSSSRSRSYSSRSRSRSYSSRSYSYSTSSSRSVSRSRTKSRSPSIPRRKGSPSFLDRRRITSARKRPVPYRRPSPVSSLSPSSSSSRSSSSSSSRSWSRE